MSCGYIIFIVLIAAVVVTALAVSTWRSFTHRHCVFPYVVALSVTYAVGILLREEMCPHAATTDADS
jgi:hypothetical protein